MIRVFKYLQVIALIFFISCKKNAPRQSPAPITPVAAGGFYGYVKLSDFTWKQYSSVVLSSIATAEFNDVAYDNTVSHIAPKDAGNVILNGIQLRRDNYFSQTDYDDTTNTIFTSPFTLHTTGSSAIPAFTLSINKPYPSFSNFAQLTDTLVKSLGFSFTLLNVADADSIFAFIQPLPYYKHIVVNGQTSVTVNFTPTELAALDLSNNKIISFHFYKYETISQNNKPYSITLLKGYSKSVFIKN